MATTTTKKVYVVAPGHSFIAKGHTYKPGDKITSAVFSDKTVWQKYLSKKWIITQEEYNKLVGKSASKSMAILEDKDVEEVAEEETTELKTEAEAKVDSSTKEATEE